MLSSNFFLVVIRFASISFTLVIRIIYRFLSWSIRANLIFCNFHTCYSTRYIDESFDITRRILSRSLTIIHHHSRLSLTIAHRHSTHSSRSFIVSRSIRHDRSSTLFISARHQLKLWKINSSKLAKILKEKYCHDFKLEICSWDLSRFDTSLDTRVYFDFVLVFIFFNMYLVTA